MTAVYVSYTRVDSAQDDQHAHRRADDGWWCRSCLRHQGIRVRAGECEPYRAAQNLITGYLQQRLQRPKLARLSSRHA